MEKLLYDFLSKFCKQNSRFPFTKVTLLNHFNVSQKQLWQVLSQLDTESITAASLILFKVYTGRTDQQTNKKSHSSTEKYYLKPVGQFDRGKPNNVPY